MSKTVLSELEQIKLDSRFLRGTIEQGLADPVTGSISEDDNKLLKFHGSYQQDDRDLRDERRRQKLEPAYSFMIRARLPGGVISPAQWLSMDTLAQRYASRGLRITTRQTLQWHGVVKRDLKATMRGINEALITTIAACGDVNRQVVGSVNPLLSHAHQVVQEWTNRLSDHFIPRTRAYHEIWLDGEKITDEPEEEPIYGPAYLPRKFKMGVAIPPINDCDVFAQDLGLIAIIEDGVLQGFNVAIGGGMGVTHGDPGTYPRLGSVIGFARPEQLLAVAEAIVTLQRDHGNRDERKHARLKYTVDRLGPAWFQEQIALRSGHALAEARPYHFKHNGDQFGWTQGEDGQWHLGLYIPAGRVIDDAERRLQTGLREIAAIHKGEFRLTCNQNIIVAGVASRARARIDRLAARHGLDVYLRSSPVQRHHIACVALPTCGLAMAESERYAPHFLAHVDTLLAKHGLADTPLLVRLSGCPNGCSRPYLGEIALVGRAPGRYDLRLGADFSGERLNRIYRENIDEAAILGELDGLFAGYATDRRPQEGFGDFLVRTGVVHA
ncbi:assimilatory sulfite reductase (NADPH) hemoprotein subunit [Paracandidimonas soli]|uniref:Sulfite reductase [NADPH] hemoprotein beta-component n=1 Tax=Paracandidimonas soli TaxID=1917182 RepID=A0A4R3USQ0_9BURK|nr:assimilatory sulfite reductase (NADPH) hemoprotein subunit [Paracandidimonas soli]TCU93727.1 sulfite reductase (NADPH) beta subunit [Paracandidimonas soli]